MNNNKVVEINGRFFEVVDFNSKLGQSIVRTYNSNLTKTWAELYKSPSNKKQSIRREWSMVLGDFVSKKYMGNCYVFSIYGKVFDYETYFLITPTRQIIVR